MTAKELKELINDMPDDATVYTEDGEGHQYCVITNIVATTVANTDGKKSIVRFEWEYERNT